MAKNLNGNYWNNHDPANVDHSNTLLGGHEQKCARYIAESDTLTFENALAAKGIEPAKLSARQAFQLLKQGDGDTVMPTPHHCRSTAPIEINVFTDGSWLHPLKQYLGLGGAGIWWPKRKLEKGDLDTTCQPLSIAEESMAHVQSCEEGVSLYTKIGGYGGSSTRTELAAGIIALCAHGPVHIGSDSRVFVNMANELLRQIRKGSSIRKPWKLQSDGDLWEHFYIAACEKGPNSIKLSWVKGQPPRSTSTMASLTWSRNSVTTKLTELLMLALPFTVRTSC